jgi:hypothetical protein
LIIEHLFVKEKEALNFDLDQRNKEDEHFQQRGTCLLRTASPQSVRDF